MLRRSPSASSAGLLFALLCCVGCRQPQGVLQLIVEGPVRPGVDFDRLEWVATTEDGTQVSSENLSGATLPELPFHQSLLSSEKTPPETRLRVSAQVSFDGRVIWKSNGEGLLSAKEVSTLELKLVPATSSWRELRPNGTACENGETCASGFCSDGVCCNRSCGGACDSCAVEGQVGRCVAHGARAPGIPSCAPYTCDGTSSQCRASCSADHECDANSYCEEARCLPKRKDGESCRRGPECAKGTCVGEVCCAQVCGEACETCALGSGECVAIAQGQAGVPNCQPYVCNGLNRSCPTTCGVTTDCAQPDFNCRAGQCAQRLSAFRDNFDDNNLSNRDWPSARVRGGGTFSNSNGKLKISTAAGVSSNVFIASASSYDARESSTTVEVERAGDPSLASVLVFFGLHKDESQFLFFNVRGGSLIATQQDSPTRSTNFESLPYQPAAMRFLRLREHDGTTFLEYSADGKSFKELRRQPNAFSMDSVGVMFSITSGVESSGASAVFDNLSPR